MARRKKSNNSTAWFIMIVIIILVIIGLYYLQHHHKIYKRIAQLETPTKKSIPKPEFDFYNILPQASNHSITPVTKNKINAEYFLQVASVKNYKEADRLKAELILNGYSVKIEEIKISNSVWNRVLIGPYHSKKEAQTAQSNIKNYKTVLISSDI